MVASLVAIGLAAHTLKPGALSTVPLNRYPVSVERSIVRGSRFVAVVGGIPSSRLGRGRQPVQKFVEQAGAVAGVNGTFFALAAIRSNNNSMIGPVMTPQGGFVPCNSGSDTKKLRGRPFLLWNREEMAFTDYEPVTMNRVGIVNEVLPDATDGFVAGAWLVRAGEVMSASEMKSHAPKDAQVARRRAFLGVTNEGKFVAGASLDSVSSAKLAIAARDLGCVNAVLLDSGYSTSVVLGRKTLASGHSTKKDPSRPVPHAVVILGQLKSSD